MINFNYECQQIPRPQTHDHTMLVSMYGPYAKPTLLYAYMQEVFRFENE